MTVTWPTLGKISGLDGFTFSANTPAGIPSRYPCLNTPGSACILAPLVVDPIEILLLVAMSAPRKHSVGHELDVWVGTALLLWVVRLNGASEAQGTPHAPRTRPCKGGRSGSAGHEQLRVTALSLRPQRGPSIGATNHVHDHARMLGTIRGGGVL